MKKYKVLPPEQTIQNIRSILSELDILLVEKHTFLKETCSCRVSIGNHGLRTLNIGTNGKGRSFEYSLASGYAEFMERLQNNLLLNAKRMLTEKTFNSFSFLDQNVCEDSKQYQYDVLEKDLAVKDFRGEVGEDLKRFCGRPENLSIDSVLGTCANSSGKLISIPFYSLRDKKEVFLPIEFLLLMTGSNGMAAGNSSKEAILQALCEIFERYAISEIYWKQLTPPSIPIKEFEGTSIYEKICRFSKEMGYTLIVKDCSLGKGIPAIGLIIIDTKRLLYNFKIGVDPNPSIALERCLTEIHQGRNDFQGLPYKFIKTMGLNEEEQIQAENNLTDIFINGTGFWPSAILEESPSYIFHGFNELLGKSNASDLEYCMNIVTKELGQNVYIRNNSILGFPAYYVVVPGISQILRKIPQSSYTSSFRNLAYLNKMGSLDEGMAKKIFEAIDQNYHAMKEQEFSLKRIFVYNTNEDLNNLSIELFMSMLCFYLGDKVNSLKYLNYYLEEKSVTSYGYFYACADFLRMSIDGTHDIGAILRILHGEALAKEVLADFASPKDIFQYYKFPNCPNCNNCKLGNECKMREIRRIQQRIKEIGLPINQKDTQVSLEDDSE